MLNPTRCDVNNSHLLLRRIHRLYIQIGQILEVLPLLVRKPCITHWKQAYAFLECFGGGEHSRKRFVELVEGKPKASILYRHAS